MRRFGRLAAAFAAAVVLVGTIVVLIMLRESRTSRSRPLGPQPSASPSPVSLFVPGVAVTSDGPRVAIGKLYVGPERTGTWWEFTVVCQEINGCHNDVEFEIDYREGGHAGRVTHRRVVDLPSLGQMKIRFMERQQHPVDAVDRVTVHSLRKITTEPGRHGPAGTPRPPAIHD